MNERYVSVRVTGDFALFTRPENKVERVSYPLMTPSAARGILEAIYGRPEFTWAVREIHVLSPVETYGILRNEVNSKMPPGRTERHYANAELKPGVAADFGPVDRALAPVAWTEELGLMVCALDNPSGQPPALPRSYKARVERRRMGVAALAGGRRS